MITTNCARCGIEIDAEISPNVDEGHLCQNCYFDHKVEWHIKHKKSMEDALKRQIKAQDN